MQIPAEAFSPVLSFPQFCSDVLTPASFNGNPRIPFRFGDRVHLGIIIPKIFLLFGVVMMENSVQNVHNSSAGLRSGDLEARTI